jgi:hypothetical protein
LIIPKLGEVDYHWPAERSADDPTGRIDGDADSKALLAVILFGTKESSLSNSLDIDRH